MTRVLVLEDERPARERLVRMLSSEADFQVVAALDSVQGCVEWLRAEPAPDLVLADVQLADGLSLEVFDQLAIDAPVVFCTAYDEHMTRAMEKNGIDYLLKPIREERLRAAIAKYRRLSAHFAERVARFADEVRPARARVVGREGDAFASVAVDELAWLASIAKDTVAVARDGRRVTLDRPLSELESELPKATFFRLNRQYLARASAIRAYRPFFKGRLLVELVPAPGEDVVVSQENAARFRAWLDA